MKLCIRDAFEWRGSRWRLLKVDKPNHQAWVIDIHDVNAWPLAAPLSELEHLEREKNDEVLTGLTPSEARAQG